jgi:hypothetical protein
VAKLNFAAQAYQARSLPVQAQQCINMFVELSPPEAKDEVPIYMAPGLSVWSRLGKGPINGFHVMKDQLYALSGGQLFQINANGLATSLGTTSIGNIASMADNEYQLVMVDGSVGWIYQPGGLNQVLLDTALGYTSTTLTATAAAGATSITVASISGIQNGDALRINLDGGGQSEVTVSGAPSGHTVTLSSGLLAQASSGNAVYDYSRGQNTITVASIGKLAVGQTINIALDSGATFTSTISAISGPASSLVITLATGITGQATAGAIAVVPSVVLGQITAPAFMPANSVIYFDDYFIFDAAGTNQFFLSALGDGTQYNGLDFASAQADPDLVVAVANYHEQLLIFGEKTVEVWYDAGSANFPFQRFDGAFIQRGCASPRSIVKEDNTIFWLGEDGIFYRLEGYTPVRISTFGMEHLWAQYPTITDCAAFVVYMEGHKFIFLNFLSGNQTWCYDVSSGKEKPLWHQRQSWGSPWV